MNNFIRNIFSGNIGEEEHAEFVKFSRGIFKNKYLLEGKRQGGGKTVVKTSAEFANYLVRASLEGLKEDKISVTGAIISTKNLRDEISFPIEKVKQFAGVKQFIINAEVSKSEIIGLIKGHPKSFFALSFKTPTLELKVKAKPPKGSKPSSKGEKEASADFCTLKTLDNSIVKDIFFDVGDFKEVSINHSLEINEIILPKGISDPVQMREQAKRKGRIIRTATIDGAKKASEKEFVA
jgi:hypothetical protein